MQVKTLFAGIAVMAISQMATATQFRTRDDGAYSEWRTWAYFNGSSWVNAPSGSTEGSNYPGPADSVQIQNTHDVIVDGSFSADTLDVDSGGTLLIAGATAQLTIDNDANITIQLDGVVTLGDGTNPGILAFVDVNQTIAGAGSITGNDNASVVSIGSGLILTNQMLLQGKMMVQAGSGTATLENEQVSSTVGAVIRANASGTLEFASSLILSDVTFVSGTTYRPTYEAVANGAVLKFSRDHDGNPDAALEGKFVLSNCGATMRFMANISTTGLFVDSGGGSADGYLDFENGATFVWNGGLGSANTDGYVGSCP
jgi:hypothetical protein